MTFLKPNLLSWIIVGIALSAILLFWLEHRFFRWVREHWFLRRHPAHFLSSVLLVAGLSLMAVILLDPRAGEIKIKGKTKQEKTIILIDTSTSMLAEDVRPSRLEKAALIAKHFVRRAVGHEISVMVFADITKKLVPFTSDRDLLDARLDSVSQLRNMNAGSSIGLAVEEAVAYFDPQAAGVIGNILVITDGEDNADTASFKVADGINLALVGVGTRAGAQIPMKDNMGMFYSNKRSQGQTVISKLNEDFFLNAVKEVKSARYFPVQSYDLPTDQIVEFFSHSKSEEKEGENVVRPVAMEAWGVPALLALLVAYLLRFWRPFMVVLCLTLVPAAWAQEDEQVVPPEIQQRLEQLKHGELNREERINLADQLVKLRMHDAAQRLYEENLDQDDIQERPQSYFNWATSELETGKLESALSRYNSLEKAHPEDAQKIRENIKRAMVPPPKKDKKKEQEKEKQDQQQKQDQKNQQGEGEGESKPNESQSQDGKQQKAGNGEPQDDKNPFDPKNKDKQDKGEGEEEKDKSDEGEEGDKDKDKPKPKPSEDEAKDGDKRQKVKVSPLVEQLKHDDRKLQLKMLDTATQKRTERKKKDW